MADDMDVEFHDDNEDQPNQDSDEAEIINEFQQNAKDLVIKHLTNYFKDKTLHIGGAIPQQFLTSSKRISMVLNYTICTGVDHAFDLIGHHDTERVLSILQNIAKSGVPKELAGGVLCLHLELVEGVNFG